MNSNSNRDERPKTASERRAEKLGLNTDPLAQYHDFFVELDEDDESLPEEYQEGDPLQQYVDKIQRRALGNAEGTIYNYERLFDEWREHMEEMGRHPALPNKHHVLAFIDKQRETAKPSTVGKGVNLVHNAFKWWQSSDDFPHTTDFDPFEAAKKLRNLTDRKPEHQKKKPPHVPLDDVRKVVKGIKHILDRSIVGCQLKFGCRSGELSNIRISEIHIDHPDLHEDYPMMGAHDMLRGRPNAVFIPHNRKGNKRERPTVLPLDKEVCRLLIDWLLVRPDVPDPDHPEDPRLFMTHKGKPLSVSDIRYIWTEYWWPEYEFDKDGEFRSVTPHFARHRFSTYWQSDLTGINREHVKYMRGDKTDMKIRDSDALDHYVHTYYEDVEDLYRNQMYPLYV